MNAVPATVEEVEALRCEGGREEPTTESLAAEVPVAMFFNGRAHAVMLATPADLADFACGFAVTERIVARLDELTVLEPEHSARGILVPMLIPDARAAELERRDRNLTGRTGCGLCGTSSLEAAIRPVRRVAATHRADRGVLLDALQRLVAAQPVNDASGAVHAAGVLATDGTLTVREDIGRHNAIDKAVGAVLRGGRTPSALLVTSRASYEVVHKAAEVGCTVVAAISAPTTLALALAREADVTLVGWMRPPRLTVYSGALA